MPIIKPPRLHPDDTVAAISLSSGAAAMFPHRYQAGKRQLEQTFGLKVIETPNALRDDAWLYANPKARAEDLHWALRNPEVKGIISMIGGDESVRVRPYLDLELIREHPKVFMGFSDTTVTLTAFQCAGVVAFHGPAMLTDIAENGGVRPFVAQGIRRTLFETGTPELAAADSWSEEFLDWADPDSQTRVRSFIPNEGWVWLQGESAVQGRLVGGNIEVLEFLKGTRWWPEPEHWQGAVLCFETSEEAPPVKAVGRFLRNYGSQGILQDAAAILFARPMRYTAEMRWQLYDEIRRILKEFCREDLPVVANMDFGHSSPQMVLPLGCRAEVNPAAQRVALLQPAVT